MCDDNIGADHKMNPVISVIIPSIGRDTLFRTLAALERQTIPHERYEVIIVLDGEYPETERKLAASSYSFAVRSLSQERAGAASARNHGASEAKGSLLVFLDDDIQPDNDLLNVHEAFHTNPGHNALAFGQVVVDQKSEHSFLKHHIIRSHQLFFDSCKNGKNQGPYFFCSANFSMQRQHYLNAGGFDTDFRGYGWEEADLGIRLKKQKIPIEYLPAAIGKEFYIKKAADTYKNAREKGANEVLFVRKHPEFRMHSELRKAFCGGWIVRWFIRVAWAHPAFAGFVAAMVPIKKLQFRIRYVQEFWAGVRSSGVSWKEIHDLFGNRVIALAYHDVVPRPRPRMTYDVRIQSFAKQMEFLAARGYNPITVSQYIQWREKGTPLPDKPLFLTIDDGYKSFSAHMAAVLKRKRFKAILFVCPEAVGKENLWDQQRGTERKYLLDWPELQALSQDFEIGSHSMGHVELDKATDAEVDYEIGESMNELSRRIAPPSAFAYPFGIVSENAPDVVEKKGYQCAFTSDTGSNCIGEDPFLLRRVMVRSWDFLPLFFLKLKLAAIRHS